MTDQTHFSHLTDSKPNIHPVEISFDSTKDAVCEQDQLSALQDKLFARSKEPTPTQQIATINLMENLVLQHVDEVIEKFHICGCERCRRDICALALNHLPPKYMVAEPDRMKWLQKEIPLQPVMQALVQAALRVRANPKH